MFRYHTIQRLMESQKWTVAIMNANLMAGPHLVLIQLSCTNNQCHLLTFILYISDFTCLIGQLKTNQNSTPSTTINAYPMYLAFIGLEIWSQHFVKLNTVILDFSPLPLCFSVSYDSPRTGHLYLACSLISAIQLHSDLQLPFHFVCPVTSEWTQ